MFCPNCRCEYREGFSRCADCNVDLVDELSSKRAAPGSEPASPPPSGRLTDFCGFFSLDEARGARDVLRRHGIRSEIAIRESPEPNPDGSLREEYWMRFSVSDARAAVELLGFDEHAGEIEQMNTESVGCPACGATVAAGETFCSNCGARFEGAG